MSQRQATFELPHRPALGREDFMVSPSNAQAVALIEQWQRWPQNRMALVGPARAGKTHLAQVWCRIAGAAPARAEGPPAPVLVEDGDRVAGHRDAEERLFHLINRQAAHGAPLLITARTRPGTWPVELPDLASRLATFAIAEIDVPDDVLLSSVLVKLFTDRQLKVSGEVIRYIALRIERSCAAAEDLVSLLDQASLEQKREITKRFVGEVTGWTA